MSRPEDEIRAKLVTSMIDELDYPRELITIEKQLKSMPHLAGQKLPDRRFDIVCFAKDLHPEHALYPLLMIECKAGDLTQKALMQVIGYNHYVAACFIGIANSQEVVVGWGEKATSGYHFQKGLPSYHELRRILRETSILGVPTLS